MDVLEHPPLLARHRLSVSDYYRMAEAGVFAPGARVELINGEVIDMAAIGTRHSAAVSRLNARAMTAAVDKALVWVRNPVHLDDFSEPEPDLMLLRPREDFYASAHPTAADVLLLIEVADSSARYDREIKLPLYARHGVVEVWIVDLDARLVRFYRAPQGERYTDATETDTPATTPVAALPGVSIDLSSVLS